MRTRMLGVLAAAALLGGPAGLRADFGLSGLSCYPYAGSSFYPYTSGSYYPGYSLWGGTGLGATAWSAAGHGSSSWGSCAGWTSAAPGLRTYQAPMYVPSAAPMAFAPAPALTPRMAPVAADLVPAPRLYAAPSAAPPSESAPPSPAAGAPRGESVPPPIGSGSPPGATRSPGASGPEPPANLKPSAVETRPSERRPAAGVKVEVHKHVPLAFDAYFVGNRGTARAGGKATCSVVFWNMTEREVTLAVEGKSYTVVAKGSMKLDLGREFRWGVNDAEPRQQKVPEEESGMEIVIRG